MALPAASFPKDLFVGNEQDTFNDGAPDPQKYQALDYNKLSSEIVSLEQQLRDGAILAVKNDSGVLIDQGDLIRLSGFDPVSSLPRIQLADASSPSTLTDAVALQSIANGSTGNVGKQFVLRNSNTQALGVAGTELFLSTTPGEVTATPPANPQHVGLVLRQSATVGVILFEVSATALVETHTLGGPAHLADTLANLNALITGGNLDFDTAQRPPAAHGSDHEDLGSDEINVAGLSGLLADPQTPTTHALGSATHLADTLANLNAKISDATLDDISGARTPVAHALGGAEHSADTLANLNSKITGGNLDFDTASRPPNGVASGQLGGTYPSPDVRGIRETGGATLLAVGAIADGEILKREGSTLVGSPSTAENLFLKARNETGSAIVKGKLLAPTGFSVPEGRMLVGLADKDDPAKRPAIGITTEIIANNDNTDVLLSVGTLSGIDTSSFSLSDQLVLGDDGNLSRPPPDVDPFTGEIQLIGSVKRVDATLGEVFVTLGAGLLPMTANQFFAVREISPTGGVSGGEVTGAAGLNVDVTAGSGFVNDDVDVFRVTWTAVTNLLLAASDTNFIFVDKNGVVQASVSPPALGNNIILADAITGAASILVLANHQVLLRERPAKTHDYVRDVIGNIVVSGVITSKDAIALRLEVDAGTFYIRDFRVTPPATDPITFTYWFRDGSGGFTRVTGSTLIDANNWDDGTGVLNSLVAGEWKKDLVFVVPTTTTTVEYHVFYGQEVFTSQSEAEGGNLPAADGDVIVNGVQSGGVVIEGAAAAIASVVDVRPFLGQLGPGTTAVNDHGLLGGLNDVADHPGFAVLDGARAYTGAQDLGNNDITNVADISAVNETLTGNLKKSTATGITAFAGGGQASATLLTKDVNEVSTVATIGDSIKLLPAAPGLEQKIINTSAKKCDVFPSSGDDLGAGVDTAISLAAGAQITYTAFDTITWV